MAGRKFSSEYLFIAPGRRLHIDIAERALGRQMPPGAEVHHVDEDKHNNAPSNLVICQDRKYHWLLHVRRRVLHAGGDPNTQRICADCKQLRPIAEFFPVRKLPNGIGNQCRPCRLARQAAAYRKNARLSDHLCECGCGQRTFIDYPKSEMPRRFLMNHDKRRHVRLRRMKIAPD